MREVPAALFGFICRVFQRYGLDTRASLEGLRLERVDPNRFGERVDWDELAQFLNRCAQPLDEAQQEALGELYPFENRYMQLGAQVLRSPRLLYRVLGYVTQAALPHMRVECGFVEDGRVRFEVRLPEHHTPCPVFFTATAGEFRTVTELFGSGRSEVEADVGPWHGRYLIRLPREDAVLEGASAGGGGAGEQVLARVERVFAWIVSQDVPSGDVDAARLRREQGLSWLEAHVALQLARGEGVARAAANLGIPVALVERHFERLEGKLPPATHAP
jgi:hypothetical protein